MSVRKDNEARACIHYLCNNMTDLKMQNAKPPRELSVKKTVPGQRVDLIEVGRVLETWHSGLL